VFAGREQVRAAGAGIAGRGDAGAARGDRRAGAGTWQARADPARLDAAAVVGFGGYPSVAPVLAARCCAIARA
jgi:UDP-N-acetylglucosamine--N-acetylmuramyl-(pentapeptide) pyrophosphoryl-undecaprenol N-acetylglucosamine transferase